MRAVASLHYPDCWIGAGFIRNLLWDHTHQRAYVTPLNDVDVIYFDAEDITTDAEADAEYQLRKIHPDINWQVRNQARMHLKHQRKPFTDTRDAMTHWVEKETAIAARLYNSQIEILAPFGLYRNYLNTITLNPVCPEAAFTDRVSEKKWLNLWPLLQINSSGP